MKTLTFQEFCSQNGVPNSAPSFPETHRKPGKLNKARDRQYEKLIEQQLNQWEQNKQKLREEYQKKLQSGELQQPTRQEQLIRTAKGHPDNQSVQASRRILAKQYNIYIKGNEQ